MAPHLKFNEGKACDAVVRVLEARAGQARTDVEYPEKARHTAPIEMTCMIGNVLFALEHTGIEPFTGHIKLDAEAGKHVRPIEEMVAGKLPSADTFELHMPAGATQRMLLKDVRRVHDALVAWIIATAPTLPIARYAELLPTAQNVQPPGVPFAVSLFRFESIIPPSRFMVKRSPYRGGYPGCIVLISDTANYGRNSILSSFYERPILNSPYRAPELHHPLDDNGQPLEGAPRPGRRPSRLGFDTPYGDRGIQPTHFESPIRS